MHKRPVFPKPTRRTLPALLGLVLGVTSLIPAANAQGKPTATTQPPDQITSQSAELNAYVNPNGSTTRVWFLYVDPQSHTNQTGFITISTAQTFSMTVNGLSPDTTYNFYVVAYNAFGTVSGTRYYFTTGSAPPTAQTLPATAITTNSATLNGLVSPQSSDTFAFFQYGPTGSYGNESTYTNCRLTTNISFVLAGLPPASTWHYRLIASNALGEAAGVDLSFTTLMMPSRLEPTYFTNSAFRLLLHTSGPGTYAVDGTSDFLQWDNLAIYFDPPEPTEILDSTAPASPMRFYRAYQIPP